MSHIRIDKQKAVKKWGPVLENMGVTNEERIDWLSEYAEFHSINENAYVNATTAGMGSITSPQPGSLPGLLGGGAGFGGQSTPSGLGIGSGDLGQNLLPVAMKIAAQTIGLDLVAVKPTPGPKIDLLYIDFQYDDLRDVGGDSRPQVFKLNSVDTTALTALTATLSSNLVSLGLRETSGGLQDGQMFLNFTSGVINAVGPGSATKVSWLEFLGFSRVDGLPMFKAYRQFNSSTAPASVGGGSYPYQWDGSQNTFTNGTSMNAQLAAGTFGPTPSGVTFSSVAIELISALEDHLPGFSANWTSNSSSGDYPMDRDTDDARYAGVIGPKISSKSVKVGTIEVSTALRRTEIEDIKANTGMDIVQKMESILVNELSQVISRQIVSRIFELGDANRGSAPAFGGVATITGQTIFDLDTNYVASGPGGETTHAVQRKLITKMLHASNYIATEGRVGPAQYAVTNGGIAAALMDVAGYTVNPVKSKLNGQGQLYPVGQIGDISIYVDPYMKYNDNRIVIGRKNNPDQPGLIFVPYLMAQSISVISEATFAPRMLLRSRYAIADVGFFPEKQYMTIRLLDANSYLN
jgi:hypothetical protein